jgi:outer membrane protein assembly factor BamD
MKNKATLLITAILIGSTALTGCQSIGSNKNRAPVYVERPVENLYNNARDQLDKKNYEEAIMGFEEVDRQHPYSEWARRAILMSAYTYYKQNKYEDAITAANRFISMYQSNQDNSAYAYYLIAICYFEQITDVGRDQRMTELALASLNEVAQRYPNTAYAKDARMKMDMTRDQLAGKEMEIGRYYLETEDNPIAAIGRFRRVVDLYQTTTHVPEALHRLVESYLAMGLVDEATKAGAVLGYNYPGSEWYERSYNLLTTKGHAPKVKPTKKGWFGDKHEKKQKMKDVKGKALKPE